jgi:hypothetical protein
VHHLNPPPFRRRNDALTAAASYGLQAISLRALRRSCDRISLLNDETRAALERRGFARERLRVVGAGIDTARFRLVPAPAPGRRVLWVHRLEPTKGVGDLPRLAALLGSETTIDVVGNGPRHVRAALERVLAAAGVAERVRLHGYVDDATLVELYARANAFVSCSYEEGWGISLCEALAVGVPCAGYASPRSRGVSTASYGIPATNSRERGAATAWQITRSPPRARGRPRSSPNCSQRAERGSAGNTHRLGGRPRGHGSGARRGSARERDPAARRARDERLVAVDQSPRRPARQRRQEQNVR